MHLSEDGFCFSDAALAASALSEIRAEDGEGAKQQKTAEKKAIACCKSVVNSFGRLGGFMLFEVLDDEF